MGTAVLIPRSNPMIEPSPFALVASQLLAQGYHPIPIMPHDKAPGEFKSNRWQLMHDWPKFKDKRPPEFLLRLWSGWEKANVSILLGTRITETHEVMAIDFDTDQADLLETMESSVPPSPVRKRGRRGYTGFYLAPIGTKGRKFKRANSVICELLTGTNTRQTVLPPSIHPLTGKPYEWLTERTLLNTPATALPVLTEDMLEKFIDTLEFMEGVKEVQARTKPGSEPASDSEDNAWRALNNAAMADLDAWVPFLPLPKLKRTNAGYQAVAWWRSSSTGRALNDRAPNLGISTTGIRDFGTDDTYTPINLVMVAANWDLDTTFGWLSRKMGMSEDWGELSLPPPPMPEPEPAERSTPAPHASDDELPEHLARVPGLLGEVTDWIVATLAALTAHSRSALRSPSSAPSWVAARRARPCPAPTCTSSAWPRQGPARTTHCGRSCSS
jgi:hypothetical protein